MGGWDWRMDGLPEISEIFFLGQPASVESQIKLKHTLLQTNIAMENPYVSW